MREPRVILVNGPAGSGKDAIGEIVARHNPNARVVRFAEILKLRTHALFGAVDTNGNVRPANSFDPVKDQPNDIFFGLTPRAAYIKVSEQWLKPFAGPQIFGDLLLREMVHYDPPVTFVITDSGFLCEALPIIEHFGVENCFRIHLSRPGKTFDGDSRSYWFTSGLRSACINNNGTLDGLEQSLRLILPELFPQLETFHEASGCFGPHPGSDH